MTPRSVRNLMFTAIGFGFLGVAAVGAVLPGLPTTVFVLLAAWAFFRGNPRHARWLIRHPHFGPLLRDWRRHRVIPPSAKIAALIMMALSLALLVYLEALPAFAVGMVAFVMGCGAVYIVACPSRPFELAEKAP